MIFSRNYLHINAQRQEFPEQGLELFDLAANEGDICRHVAGCIPLHWHPDLELFVLLEGCAQVTAGGVDTRRIDPATMVSRLHEGLYFAGEMVDVDGICGGYNLQWAWSSGSVAGRHAAGQGG